MDLEYVIVLGVLLIGGLVTFPFIKSNLNETCVFGSFPMIHLMTGV